MDKRQNCNGSTRSKWPYAGLGGVALLMLGGCATSKPSPLPVTIPASAASVAAPAATPAPGTDSVPVTLSKIGGDGEDLYDQAKARQWPQMAAKMTDLKQRMPQLPTDLGGATENQIKLNASVVALEKSIAQKDKLGAMRVGNQITRLAADMSRPYKPAVPVEVTLLDYYGRELELGVLSKDPTSLTATVTQMRETWTTLRPVVVAHGGRVQANKFDLLMARAAATHSPTDFASIAATALNQVDGLEKVFTA